MRKRIGWIILAGFLVVACSSAGTPAANMQTVTPAEPAVTKATNTAQPSEAAPPTEIPKTELEPGSTTPQAMPGCTAKSLFPTPDPATEALFPPVTDADWRRGPKTASVTLIEYSDFQ
jgi:hypothetical protein